MMLDEPNIKVAQYLTVLPDKQWFIDKLNRSILIARELKQHNYDGDQGTRSGDGSLIRS